MDRGNDKISVRFSPEIHYRLEQQAKASRKTKTEIVREAVEQHLFGEEWLSKCDAVLKTSIIQVEESHRALEARIHRLVDEGAIDFEIQTVNAEVAKSEERMQAFFESKFKTGFENMLRMLPPYIIQLHENQGRENEMAAEARMQEFFESKFQAAFDKMLKALPPYIIRLHENQKAQSGQK